MNSFRNLEAREEKKGRYEFSIEFEGKIISMLLMEPDKQIEIFELLRTEYFENPFDKVFIKLIIMFVERYKRPIQLDEFVEEIERFLKDPQLEFYQDDYLVRLNDLLNETELKTDYSYIWNNLTDFCRFESMKNTIINSAGKLKQLGIDEALNYMEPAISKIKQIGHKKLNRLDVVNLSEVERKSIEWFWKDRIPKGKLSLIVGDPGVGKSFFTMFLTAHVTTGRPWPDKRSGAPEQGKVIILTAEDGLSDTVVPRVEDNGGDKAQVFVIRGIQETNSYRGFNLAKDVLELEELIKRENKVRLIIIDPVSAYLGFGRDIDSHKDKDVRGVLTPLANLAEKYGITIIGVLHLNKSQDLGAIHRVSGSMAFVATARAVWVIAKEKRDGDDPALRYFVPAKTNHSINPEGLVFKIVEGRIVFQAGKRLPSIADLLSSKVASKTERPRDFAKQFLLEILKDGPVDSSEVLNQAEEKGIAQATLYNAKKELRIESIKIGGDPPKWIWELPPGEK